MRRRIITSLTMATAAILAGCGSEDGGTVSVKLALRGDSAAVGATAGKDAQGTDFTVASARAYVRHIQFDLPDGKSCDEFGSDDRGTSRCDSDKISIEGPFEIDLKTGTSKPSLAGVTIPSGTYKRVDVRFDDAKVDDGVVASTDPLSDNTILASGTFPYRGSTTNFELVLKFTEDARFEEPNGIFVDASAPADVMLWLDVSKWFSALPLTQCIDDGDLDIRDGQLLVSDDRGSCSTVENALKETIKSSGQLDKHDR